MWIWNIVNKLKSIIDYLKYLYQILNIDFYFYSLVILRIDLILRILQSQSRKNCGTVQ